MHEGERQVAPTLAGIRRDHVARYEWAAHQLQLVLPKGASVLDLACGIGYGSAILADAGFRVLGVDRDTDAIDYGINHYARPSLDLVAAPAERCSYEGFDAVVCFETIEHIKDPRPVLRMLSKAAPVLLASVPNEAVFPHNGRVRFHHRHYTRAEFTDLIEETGWKVRTWYGQAGPHSEVEPDCHGRTLIAVCDRAQIQSAAPRVETAPAIAPGNAPAAPAPVPDHVAIVGLGPSCATFFELTRRLGGVSAWCDEVWGINGIGDVLRCDRVFHMDDLRIQEARAEARPESNIAAMVRWLKTHPGPVYTSVVREGYPGLVAFPLQDVLNGGLDRAGGAPYFNSTAAYAIAFAVHLGVKRISLFGLDYTLANAHQAERGRACCEFWLGIAAARGIEINLPETTSLMDACETPEMRLYGYDCVDVTLRDQPDGRVEVHMTPRSEIPSAAEIERRYDHSQHPSPLMRGAAPAGDPT